MPIIVLEHSSDPGSGSIGRALARHGLRVQPVRLAAGESVPGDLDDIDGVVSMGGRQSATDDRLPWIAAELSLLRDAHASGIPVLGVCLGAQLLARALGGRVDRMSTPSLGLPRIDLTPVGREDPMFRGLPWFGSWPSWHQDQVVERPPEGQRLAGSADCEIEAFSVGISSYGIQFHAEWSGADLAAQCEKGDPGSMGSSADLAALAATARDSTESIDRQSERIAENVASYLMPIERVNQGVARDIHH